MGAAQRLVSLAEERALDLDMGSSAMPHKRNSIGCEHIRQFKRGASGTRKVALWHERDISHSSVERVILPR